MPAPAHEEAFKDWLAGLGDDILDIARPLWDTIDDNRGASHEP
jgi:hypothetical protein